MSVVTVPPGALFVLDPAETKVVQFDWDQSLAEGAIISTSTFTGTAKRPSTASALTLTGTGTGLGIAVDGRSAKVKVSGGDLGAVYELAHTVTTDETPAQIKERSIRVLVQNQ